MMSSSSNICTQLALRQHAPHTAPALWRSSLSARRQNLHPFHNLHIPAAAAVIPGHVLGALEAVTQQKKAAVSRAIRLVPDFPKAGVIFQDVSTLLLDPAAFQYTIDLLVDRYKDMDVQCIAGELLQVCCGSYSGKGAWWPARKFRCAYTLPNLPVLITHASAGFEARGFIFGPPVALALRVPFVMIRKAGKLPGGF